MMTGNKGEWSELYVLFKLLADRKLFSADESLMVTDDYVEVKSVTRRDNSEALKYTIDDPNSCINIYHWQTNQIILSFRVEEVKEIASSLIREINAGSGSSFSVSHNLESVLKRLAISKVKEKSSNKGDIDIVFYDPIHSITSNQKFSIKSFLGSQPTLFNANKTTNIIYKIHDGNGQPMPSSLIREINSIGNPKKYIKRVKHIVDLGYCIAFDSFSDSTFKLNLQLIDSDLPLIIASVVLNKYLEEITKITDVIEFLNTTNPMNYDLSQGHNFYEYRIINFLIESSLGMTSKTVWSGDYENVGGIIIVKPDAEVLCYHLVDFMKFKHYLKSSCRIDNPSGSKMGYGEVFESNGETFIKLNFQVKA